jgi:asparagine synthase (glutamine-hydrolysing)
LCCKNSYNAYGRRVVMKQFLAVAALNEAVEMHCDTRRDVKIYTEGFKAVQHEAMEFSVMCDAVSA